MGVSKETCILLLFEHVEDGSVLTATTKTFTLQNRIHECLSHIFEVECKCIYFPYYTINIILRKGHETHYTRRTCFAGSANKLMSQSV